MSGGTGQLYRGAEERNANMELERGMLQMKENGRETETVGECKKRTCAETLQRAKDGENGTNA